ncbi:MAG: efflux RND transporter periplasmic adaptor subunit [Burkholderiaceae bacterium]|nr:efflux RND transporter periplasmic adaptor subunit [Burkholderiaceae bacterium]MEB2352085.1 efflux RND transporter periplasmic adaptor subunit [Burkholderiaceae bacterium]
MKSRLAAGRPCFRGALSGTGTGTGTDIGIGIVGIGVAAMVAGAVAFAAPRAFAHEGEAHGDPAAGRTVDAVRAVGLAGGVDAAVPRRAPDGAVFVPKPTQYRIGLRTRAVEARKLAVTVALAGTVVAEPNAGGRVQSTQTGRIQPGPKGLPMPGQRVAKGAVLAYVEPAIASLERASRQADLAALEAQLAIANARAARYAQLDGAVPRKDIEAARIDALALAARRDATARGLAAREALRAPVSGIVSTTSILAGQIVEPREILVEIVDPSRLAIEALAYDPAVAGMITGASAMVTGASAAVTESSGAVTDASAAAGSTPLELQLVGASRHLRGQAVPLLFRARTAGVALAIGQPLQVIARTAQQREGFALPREAIVRERSGEHVVWVHEAAERFVPRRVAFQTFDADTVVVTAGLAPRERVVVSGANLLAQVR